MITEQQKRVIRENKNLPMVKLSTFLGLPIWLVRTELAKTGKKWSYSGVGIPFCRFTKSPMGYTVFYKNKRIANCCLSTAIKVVDHLLCCIESDMFDQPRIENPYLTNLKFGE